MAVGARGCEGAPFLRSVRVSTYVPLDSRGRPLDEVRISSLKVNCSVGIYSFERNEPQAIELDISLYLDTRKAVGDDGLGGSIDYARLSGELRFILERCRFQMLEGAAEALCRYILAPP